MTQTGRMRPSVQDRLGGVQLRSGQRIVRVANLAPPFGQRSYEMTAAEEALLARLMAEDQVPWITPSEHEAADLLAERGLVHVCLHPTGARLAYPTFRATEGDARRAAPTPLHPSLLP
jgi:hypothetical protein